MSFFGHETSGFGHRKKEGDVHHRNGFETRTVEPFMVTRRLRFILRIGMSPHSRTRFQGREDRLNPPDHLPLWRRPAPQSSRIVGRRNFKGIAFGQSPLFIGNSRTSGDCVLSSAAAILLSHFVPRVRLFTRAPLIRWAA
jgi:hypothetical protein